MNLREFVSESITQLMQGVQDADKKAKEMDSIVNPIIHGPRADAPANILPKGNSSAIFYVDFDIAVTATEKDEIGGDAGLKVAGIGGQLRGATGSENSQLSRMKFTLPITLPARMPG